MEKTMCFTGHRPKYFYDIYDIQNEFYKPFIESITKICTEMIEQNNVANFISGSALGIDMIAFFCVHKLKSSFPNIKNKLAIPFKCQGDNWSDKDLKWLDLMKDLADEVIYVDTIEEYKLGTEGIFNPKKLDLRNQYMVDNSDYVLAIWNGEKSGTKNCISYALSKEKKIKYIYVNKGENMKIVNKDYKNELDSILKNIGEKYNKALEDDNLSYIDDIAKNWSEIIDIFERKKYQTIEFDENSPLEKVIKDTCSVSKISGDKKIIEFTDTNGLNIIVNI